MFGIFFSEHSVNTFKCDRVALLNTTDNPELILALAVHLVHLGELFLQTFCLKDVL